LENKTFLIAEMGTGCYNIHACDEPQIVFDEISEIMKKGGLTQNDNSKTQEAQSDQAPQEISGYGQILYERAT
jgi:hypothetical protein